MKPLVSILIPAFNSQEWIADTILSALAQTWERKEIIVVDDGSCDRTLAVAKRFASRDVVVIDQENQGAAATRNKALSLSQGDYIQWLDADDLLAPDKIARQLQKLDLVGNKRMLLSSAWGSFMYRPHKAEFTPTLLWCDLSPAEWLYRKMAYNLHMQTATWLVSRELTEAAGPWNVKQSVDDDGEYFCRVLLESNGVRFVPEAKVFYRMSGSNSLSYIGHSDSKMDSLFLSMQRHIESLCSLEESSRVRDASVRYLQASIFYFYPERPELVGKAKEIAVSMGGRLVLPHLPWKYAWIRALFGWNLAKRAQVALPAVRWAVARSVDKLLFRMGRFLE